MDYTQNLSDIEAGLAARTSTIAQATGEQEALSAAKDIITTGYQSDQASIAAAVTSQVGDIQTQNTTFTAQVADLNGTIATLQGQIAQIQTILADGSGSDNQIAEITALLAPPQS